MESRLEPAERETLRSAAVLMERMAGGSNRTRPADLVFNLIPSARVAGVQRSVAFYERLGFVVDGRWEDGGTLVWASMHAKLVRAARIMFSGGPEHGAPPEPRAQGINFYCWTDNIAALHARLTAEGLAPGAIAHPEHMADGEFALTDPDGYRLLVGQVTRRR
jgi:catechol 2,3-dioxygenase-like lactoylglutathione lyase family enzyme